MCEENIIFNNYFIEDDTSSQLTTNFSPKIDLFSIWINPIIKRNLFLIYKKKRPGIQVVKDNSSNTISSSSRTRRSHDNRGRDNILTKIQVNYMNFIVNFTNDVIKTIFGDAKQLFILRIGYKLKNKTKRSILDELKKMNIEDILILKESPKCKKVRGNIDPEYNLNEIKVKKIKESSEWMSKYFKNNYIKFFKYYFNNLQPMKAIDIEGKKIYLSKKTKSFYDLIIKDKNKKIMDKLVDTAKSIFLKETTRPIFFTEK